MPELRVAADLASHYNQLVRAFGTYVAEDTSPYRNVMRAPDGRIIKTYVIGVLDLGDKTQIELGIRPEQELAEFHGKKVAIVGRVLAPHELVPGMAQQVPRPRLIEIQAIELR